MRRKLTALLTAVLLAVTLIPMTAWAEVAETMDAVFAVETAEITEIEEVAEITEEAGNSAGSDTASGGKLLGTVSETDVCKIGDQGYASLQDAVNSVESGSSATIIMLKDYNTTDNIIIPYGVSITLDLSGHLIAHTVEKYSDSFFKVFGSLTVKDTAGGGKITACSMTDWNNGSYTIDVSGPKESTKDPATFVLESGTIENTSPGGLAWPINIGSWGTYAEGTIKGGEIISKNYVPIRLYLQYKGGKELTINGGTFIGANSRAVSVQFNDAAVNEDYASLTINGGDFYGGPEGKGVLYFDMHEANTDMTGLTYEITGGNFYAGEGGMITQFDNEGKSVASAVYPKVTLSGGYFTMDPTAEAEPVELTLADGYEVLNGEEPLKYRVCQPCTVTYHVSDKETKEVIVAKDEAIEEENQFIPEGENFGGWFKDETFQEEYDFTEEVTGDTLDLYAKWLTYYQVTFDTDGGEGTFEAQKIESGKTASEPKEKPEKEGFDFAGWYLKGEKFDFGTHVTEDITLTAKWEEKIPEYTVTFDAQGGTPEPAKQTVEKGKSAQKPETDPAKDGFTFLGWYNGETEYKFTESVTEDMTLTAKWEATEIGGQEIEIKPVAPEVEVTVKPASEAQEQAVKEIIDNPELKSEETTKTLVNALKTEELKIDEKAEKLEVKLDINLLSMDSNSDDTKVTSLTFDVKPILIQKDEKGEIIGTKQEIPNSALNQKKIYVRLPIPSSISDNYAKVIHRSDDGKEEQIRPYPEVQNKGTNKAFVQLQITHFSEFELTFTNQQYVAPTYVSTGSSERSDPLFTGTWNNPVKNGSWSQDAQGIWHYASSQTFRNTWGYIFNPYAKEGQHTSDWFWFDHLGNMLTGWQFINGKWYYLNPNKDGTLGACLLGPGKTPDGYEIDASGAWTGK